MQQYKISFTVNGDGADTKNFTIFSGYNTNAKDYYKRLVQFNDFIKPSFENFAKEEPPVCCNLFNCFSNAKEYTLGKDQEKVYPQKSEYAVIRNDEDIVRFKPAEIQHIQITPITTSHQQSQDILTNQLRSNQPSSQFTLKQETLPKKHHTKVSLRKYNGESTNRKV